MPNTLTNGEILPETAALELNGVMIPGTIGPEISFLSSDTGVFGLSTDQATGTLQLEIVAPGTAVLKVLAPCTFADPQNGKQITQTKSKSISLTVSGQSPNWTVVLN